MKVLGWIIGVAVVILALVFVFGYLGDRSSVSDLYEDGMNATTTENVIVTSPSSGSVVRSPLTVTGEARGTWFFEANLPIAIYDAMGNRLGEVGAQAEGEWMTTNFVPFRAVLTFEESTTAIGTLVVMKDNPSGLPENDDEVRIPIRFR